jgi:hypothetical protein
MQQQSISKEVKYGLIILCGIILLGIVDLFPFAHCLVLKIVETIAKLNANWMILNFNQSAFFYVISWLASFFYLIMLGLGGLVVLCCFPVIYILRFANPQLLPEKNAYSTSLNVINGWLILVLLTFFIVSLVCVLEPLGRFLRDALC